MENENKVSNYYNSEKYDLDDESDEEWSKSNAILLFGDKDD